ncbi:MAG: c-type cytochrome, methanol metabolism-related [Beijerinckiaceae bacterium]
MRGFLCRALLAGNVLILPVAVLAEGPADPAAVKNEDGKYRDAKGAPTYKLGADKSVDWYTYSGFRRYHSECHVCHGPDGEGSSYAPALANSLKTLGYEEFYGIVVGGRQNVGGGRENVMPAFGENKNVMCYLDDIYVYLRARANDAVGRGRPAKHEDKPPAFDKAEQACMSAS